MASLVETAKLKGIEPFAWLRDVLARMIDRHPVARLSELLPFPRSANGWFGGETGMSVIGKG